MSVRASDGRGARQAGRFVVVGASQNLLNLGLFAALTAVRVQYLLAAVLAGAAALLASFAANRHWTFEAAGHGRAGRQLVSYVVVFAAMSLLALGLLAAYTELLGLPHVVAQGCALLCAAPISFLLQRGRTFRRRP